MKLNIIDVDKVSESLPLVDNYKIFESRRFARDGLFSAQIFGPVKSYHCVCAKHQYKGPRYNRKRCPVCGVDIVSSSTRRRRFGKIELPFPIMNPLFFYLIAGSRPTIRRIFVDMLYYRAYFLFNDEGELERYTEADEEFESITRMDDVMVGLAGVKKYIEYLIEINDEFDETDKSYRKELAYTKENIDLLTVRNVIVIPPEFRPCSKGREDKYIVDEINKKYHKIIKISNSVKSIPYNIRPTDDVYKANFRYIQKIVFDLYDYVLNRMNKKTGLIRSNILGKRVDFSGRAVISPSPTLNLDECGLPYWMILEILKPQLVAHFVNRRICKRYNHAIKLIDDSIHKNDTSYLDIIQDFCKGMICVLNRQPTLHRLSVLAFKVKVHTGNTIQIHPMICEPFNADFDGDAMAVYFPVTDEAKEDVEKHLAVWNNIISPTNLESVPKPNQDIILGIYAATKENSNLGDPVELNGEEISYGRYLFNKCFPDNYPVVDETITKDKLYRIVNDITIKYPSKVVLNVFDNLKNLGFSISTLKGYTMGLPDLYRPDIIKLSNKLTGNVEKDIDLLHNDAEIQEKLHTLPFSIFIDSGARGSWDQARQMVVARGYVADANNKVRGGLIKSSFVEGLTQREYFNSCWGSRKGLLDTALSTGDSGYLTRQLIYSTSSIELDDDPDKTDCGTTDYLEIDVQNKSIAKALVGRYYVTDDGIKKVIKSSSAKSLVGKKIRLRSPIYCKNHKVCKTCYGNLYHILHSTQIGIIATQALGERAVQLVLRTFHISGAVQGVTTGEDKKNDSKDSDDIISGMAIVKRLFHNPRKVMDIAHPGELVEMLYKIFRQYGSIHMVHFEVIISAMMWYENSLWRLLENRDEVKAEYVSILQVPSKLSWLLGSAFSNLKQRLIEGLVNEDVDKESSITTMFRL